MPIFGSHLSVSGGYCNAARAAGELGLQAVQIFSHSPSQWVVALGARGRRDDPADWHAKPLDAEQVGLFRDAVREVGLAPPIVHNSYLINLCSQDAELLAKSRAAMVAEVRRAAALGALHVVAHPGSAGTSADEEALALIAESLDYVFAQTPDSAVMIALENTAGQGKHLGWRFEHLGEIVERTRRSDRLSVCFDTCHAFAAGYELSPKKAFLSTMKAFDASVGIERLAAFHVNDSKKGLGSRVDRHEHIGVGCLGDEPFRYLVNDRRFRNVPMILETAKENDPKSGRPMDAINLERLQGLIARRK